jgi:hypothetical protein
LCGALKLANAGVVDSGVGVLAGAWVGATVTGTGVAERDADGLVWRVATGVSWAGLRSRRKITATTARMSTAAST